MKDEGVPMDIALVNTNRIQPPIAPIGLEYIAEAVHAAGYCPDILDLCWENAVDSAIADFFGKKHFDVVGLTLRNTDDCAFTSRQSFLGDFASIIKKIRSYSDALIVAGGVGFSVMPASVLQLCEADIGIWGDGEWAMVDLIKKIHKKREWHTIPNLFFYRDGKLCQNQYSTPPLHNLPLMSRSWFDNRRYFREGGQAGIETKRGCHCQCVYCADPVAKGKEIRTRPPQAVVNELERLLEQGIDHIHTCDSEFNIPIDHAMEVGREIIRRGLHERLRWYAYCSPLPFSEELAFLMKKAGCVGINFSMDSGDERMLRRLKRNFFPKDMVHTISLCKKAGMTVMTDLLIGSPGETEESIATTIHLLMGSKVDRAGVTVGVRIYPGTELGSHLNDPALKAGCIGGNNPMEPLFFLEPGIAPSVFHLLDELIGQDERFLFFDPSRPDKNYNYNANQLLVDAIKQGYRGAYWHILRRYSQGLL
ncbi:MAG: B12-binding domain-containing radical SAM protein [bacterium]